MSTSDLAGLIESNHAALLARECDELVLAAAWADRHYLDPNGGDYQPLIERACAYGGDGTPEVSEYCCAELGALLGIGILAARLLIGDALDVRYRLPRLWARVRTGGVRAWQARKVAETTRLLSAEAAADLDYHLADSVGMMPWGRFRRMLAAAVMDADPDWCASGSSCSSASGSTGVVAYEVSPRLQAAVRYRQVADVFPFGTCISPSMDLDHTQPYRSMDYGGPPGQTRLGNLGPVSRSAHRAVTHGGWDKSQPEPGYFVHRSPYGHVWLVTNQGTLALGRTGFSDAIWNIAAPARVEAVPV